MTLCQFESKIAVGCGICWGVNAMPKHLGGVIALYEGSQATADEVLVAKARSGCDDSLTALMARYLPLISTKARGYGYSFLEKDDLVQEGMIALLKAIRSFVEEKGTSFNTFAAICIDNSIKSAVRSAGRLKHMPLNNYVPLYSDDISNQFSENFSAHSAGSPEALVIKKEEYALIKRNTATLLSGFEREILMLYLNGCTYEQMAAQLSVTVKSVDNALQRVRRKFCLVMH